MNFKKRTIDIKIKVSESVISNSSALFLGNNTDKYLLSSKHSFCVNYADCEDKTCNFCDAPTNINSLSSNSFPFSVTDIYQSSTKDIAIAKIITNTD
jgi:hypothetical protein